MKTVTFSVKLDAKHALPLAQFLRRVGFSTCKQLSDPYRQDEPYYMMSALEIVRDSLAKAGYAPR